MIQDTLALAGARFLLALPDFDFFVMFAVFWSKVGVDSTIEVVERVGWFSSRWVDGGKLLTTM